MRIRNLILFGAAVFLAACSDNEDIGSPNAVSYTHLTLPTIA